jgi:sulfite reductase (ferredoxin)
MDEAIEGLHIKISGCFNSCGQHHIADLGFYGVSRNKAGYTVPHFQVVLGGQWTSNAGAYGLAIGAVPSKRIPETVDRITERYLSGRQSGETFQQFIKRIGKAECKKMIDDLTAIPPHDADPSVYTDWADAREYTIGDIGIGECAGEVVSAIDFQLTATEREAFEAQLKLEEGDIDRAAALAFESMHHAALALVRQKFPTASDDAASVLNTFKTLYYDTELFFDPFTGGKFAQYYFKAFDTRGVRFETESARQLIEEAQLFIEAAHSCYARMSSAPVVAGKV